MSIGIGIAIPIGIDNAGIAIESHGIAIANLCQLVRRSDQFFYIVLIFIFPSKKLKGTCFMFLSEVLKNIQLFKV